jgi:hypothetical protein
VSQLVTAAVAPASCCQGLGWPVPPTLNLIWIIMARARPHHLKSTEINELTIFINVKKSTTVMLSHHINQSIWGLDLH